MTANDLNSHLASGGVVQVTTYLKSTIYTAKHAGWFTDRKDGLYVRQGRGVVYLGPGGSYVSIRTGRYVEESAETK